jgi:hypothetical protein
MRPATRVAIGQIRCDYGKKEHASKKQHSDPAKRSHESNIDGYLHRV